MITSACLTTRGQENSISCLKFINQLTVGPSHTKYHEAGPLCQNAVVNWKKNAEFIDRFLQLKSKQDPSFIKDTPDFLNKIKVYKSQKTPY